MGRLTGKVAVITGATAGIGRAIADRFGAEGASLVLCGRNADRANLALEELRAAGVNAEFVLGDIRSSDYLDRLADHVRGRHGQIDCLVLNAGIYSAATLFEISPEQFDEMMEVNVRAPWLCVRALQELLGDGASVVAMGSVSSFAVFAGEGVYCMTKAAILQMTRMLALEVADRGIRVNLLCPGFIGEGGMTQDSLDEAEDASSMVRALEDATPLRRLGTLKEIADGALFLASEESSFMTGRDLVLDGGMIIPRA